MSSIRKLRRRRHGNTSKALGATLMRQFWANVLTPAELAELPGDDSTEERCGATPPELAGAGAARCLFRKGHKCKCRFFGNVEHGK